MPFNDKLKNLSILIVTYKGDELLSNCLVSLTRACGNLPEIVVVDNCANDSTKEMVLSFPSAKYVPSENNLGFAGGNNLGLPHCTRPYILLLNNDTVIHEDSFSPLVEYMETNPKVAITQGKMRLSLMGDVLDECGLSLTSTGGLYGPFSWLSATETITPTRAVYSIKGAMMLIRRDVIREMDDLLFYSHFYCNHEETDFCHRVWLRGYEVHYVDTPPIDHLQNQTIAGFAWTEVRGRSLANQIFSLGTTLEPFNAMRFILAQLLWHLMLAILLLCKGNVTEVKILIIAVKYIWRYRPYFWDARKKVQRFRKISDKDLFDKVMISIPQKYYYHMLRGSGMAYKAYVNKCTNQ